MNQLVGRNISAVSNKTNTTDNSLMGLYTDIETKTQLHFWDTPGVTKASNSMRSSKLVTKAWDTIEESDQVMFVVDSVKRLSFEVRKSLI
jgi:GTPase Era involved in 16S rRNA processing